MTQQRGERQEHQAPPESESEPLSGLQRALAGFVGVVCASAGATATFVEGTNEGGAPLLLGVGALFLYLALSGQRLTLLEAGGAKAELARTVRVVETVISNPDVPDDAKVEIAEAVVDERLALNRNAQRVVHEVLDTHKVGLQYERWVMDAIHRLRPDLMVSAGRPDRSPDLWLSDGNRAVPVIIKLVHPRTQVGAIAGLITNEWLGSEGQQHLVVVSQPTAFLRSLVRTLEDRLVVAHWKDERHDPELREALDRIFPPSQ